MRHSMLLVGLSLACAAPVTRPAPPLPVAKYGALCWLGERHSPPRQVAVCADGLECCTMCGIQGCDSTCHTPAECSAKVP